jgi:hypothetical protein
MRRALALSGFLILASAAPAHAEWHFTPMAGLTALGSTTIFDPELATDKRHWNLGGAVSLLGPSLFGAEVITTWTPGFFEAGDLDFVASSRALSLMANVVLTTPRRWTEYSLRPFVSGGFGLMHIAKEDDGIFPVDLNLAGFNVGGGAVGFFSERTGVRFDVRYHSTLRETDQGPIAFGPVRFRYLTASVGIVFRR